MTKKELTAIMSKAAGITKADAGRVLQAFLDTVTESLAQGERVTINGFGTFRPVSRAAKKACNPRTGEGIIIPARTVARFKPAKKLAETLIK